MHDEEAVFPVIAYIRRLSADGWDLYIRLDRTDIARHGLEEGQEIQIEVGGKVTVRGIVRTAGAVPWLGPVSSDSNQGITDRLKSVGFTHGDDMPSRIIV